MRKFLTLGTTALIALSLGLSAHASAPSVAALTRQVEHGQHRIHRLEQRRAYLHRYIRHLRKTTTPITHTHVTTSYTSSSGSWADELRAVGFPESAISTMLYYISRESGGDPSALNPTSNACGLTQIYPYVPGCLDPMTNLRLAFQKYQASGFAPWGG